MSEHEEGCMCGFNFSELEGQIGKAIFHEIDHHGASVHAVQQALASILWGFLGGYDGETLTEVRIYRGDGVVNLDVIEKISDEEN